MRKTKNFNIQVPELGDVPDITQVSNAIQDLEDALAGTLEIMDASIQGSGLTLSSVSRKTKRTKYYDGMSMRFLCPQTITANTLKTVVVDDLPQQVITVPFDIIAGEYVDITYRGTSFTAHPVIIQKSESIDSNSNETVATSKAVKKVNDKVNNEVSELNKNKVSKSGDTMTGSILFNNVTDPITLNYSTSVLGLSGFARGLSISMDKDVKAEFGLYGVDGEPKTIYIGKRYDDKIINLNYDGTTTIKAANLKTNSKEVISAINELHDGKEPAFSKKSGFNLDKTDNATNDTNKLFTAKGAYNLKNEVDTKVSKSGDVMTGSLRITNVPNPLIANYTSTQLTGGFTRGYQVRIGDVIKSEFGMYGVDGKEIYTYLGSSYVDPALKLFHDGTLYLKANNLKTNNKEVVTAINELKNEINKEWETIFNGDVASGTFTTSKSIWDYKYIQIIGADDDENDLWIEEHEISNIRYCLENWKSKLFLISNGHNFWTIQPSALLADGRTFKADSSKTDNCRIYQIRVSK